MDLHEETLRLLEASEHKRTHIASKTGLNIHWLNKLANGKIPDPGIRKIQRLYDYLNKA